RPLSVIMQTRFAPLRRSRSYRVAGSPGNESGTAGTAFFAPVSQRLMVFGEMGFFVVLLPKTRPWKEDFDMMDATKYQIGYYPPPVEPGHVYEWMQKDHIETAPAWCSVDLRDGNQSLVVP
ncbi:Transcriptional regulator, partial [Dysosmobacter welbionis]